jgi:hypothetical protein
MRDDPVTSLPSTPFGTAGSDAPRRPLSIGERLSPPAAAGEAAARSETCDTARRQQATQLDVWEDEGGTTAGHLSGFPRQHAERHVDKVVG